MSQVKNGDKVKVHYTGKLEDGTVFDSSREREPLEVTVGSGNLIPGFENAVIGMKVGEIRTITIEPEDAYGQWRKELTANVNKSEFPEGLEPSIGKQLQLKQNDGRFIDVIITEMEDDIVTLDANHPLAGKTLIFEIELMEVA